MASIVSLLPDHKTVYHVDDQGNRSILSLTSTHGVNFSVDTNGEVTAVEATSAASGGTTVDVKLESLEWSLAYRNDGTNKKLMLIGSETIDFGIKSDHRSIDISSTTYNLKRVNDTIEITPV